MTFYYHATSERNLSQIMREGLRCACSTFWTGRGGCIYLTAQPEDTKAFGEVILCIDGEGLHITRVSDWEYICWEDIHPARLISMVWLAPLWCQDRRRIDWPLAGFIDKIKEEAQPD